MTCLIIEYGTSGEVYCVLVYTFSMERVMVWPSLPGDRTCRQHYARGHQQCQQTLDSVGPAAGVQVRTALGAAPESGRRQQGWPPRSSGTRGLFLCFATASGRIGCLFCNKGTNPPQSLGQLWNHSFPRGKCAISRCVSIPLAISNS